MNLQFALSDDPWRPLRLGSRAEVTKPAPEARVDSEGKCWRRPPSSDIISAANLHWGQSKAIEKEGLLLEAHKITP